MQTRDPSHISRSGRKVYYTKDVDAALYTIWKAANNPCGLLLHPLIKEYVQILERDSMWNHSSEATGKLLAMSMRTVRRRCTVLKKKYKVGKGKSATRPSNLKRIIPIFKGPWKDLPPGEGQLDTVAHCGGSLLGDYVFSLNYTDSATYWLGLRAQWNKGAVATKESMEHIVKGFPIEIKHIHPDTGSEFINYTLKPWCDDIGIRMTRSEPGKSNDNMMVEERNGHVIRKYLGYTRYDCPLVVDLINELYEVLEDFINHFQVVRRTASKKRVGAKYVRTYEVPMTPYAKMLAHPEVGDDVKTALRAQHEKLNPLVLKRKIDMITSLIVKKQREFGTPKD